MKKPLLLIPLFIFAAVVAFYLSQKKENNSRAEVSPPPAEQPETTKPTRIQSPVPRGPQVEVSRNELITNLRTAVASKDGAAMEAAYKAMIAHFEAHPEQVTEYVEIMRTEKDEHVLRMFARAMAESESGLVANEEIIKTAMELAKDSSFEQRQHIMLHLMSNCEVRDDILDAILDISKTDPNGQVKTSGLVVMADWMEKFPDQSSELLQKITDIFKTAQDEDVRDFSYQVLALHKEQLTKEMHQLLSERLISEPDTYSGNLIASALFAAPDDIRLDAMTHTQSAFNKEADPEKKRNLLAQLVCLSRGEVTALLQEMSSGGETPIAQDARDYLAIVSKGGPFEPHDIFTQKGIRDGIPSSCSNPDHKHQ